MFVFVFGLMYMFGCWYMIGNWYMFGCWYMYMFGLATVTAEPAIFFFKSCPENRPMVIITDRFLP